MIVDSIQNLIKLEIEKANLTDKVGPLVTLCLKAIEAEIETRKIEISYWLTHR